MLFVTEYVLQIVITENIIFYWMKIAVITGDIVNSTEIDLVNKKIFFAALSSYLKEIEEYYQVKIEIFRGDSFQCVIPNIQDALQISLEILTFIRSISPSKEPLSASVMGYNVRISVGIGEMDFVQDSALTSDGTAFRLSGRQLDDMKGKKQYLMIASDDNYHRELQMESALLDVILSNNTIQQNEVMNRKLRGSIEKDIAEALKIKQPAVNQRLKAGNWHIIDLMLKYYKSLYSNG